MHGILGDDHLVIKGGYGSETICPNMRLTLAFSFTNTTPSWSMEATKLVSLTRQTIS